MDREDAGHMNVLHFMEVMVIYAFLYKTIRPVIHVGLSSSARFSF